MTTSDLTAVWPDVIPDDWTTVHLRQCLSEYKERAKSQPLEVFSCSKLHGVILQSLRFKHRLASKNQSRYKVVRSGMFVYDPMLLWDGSIGKNDYDFAGVVSPAYFVLACIEGTDADYLEYLLRSSLMLSAYRRISEGTNVRRKKAKIDDFLQISIHLPPFPEQRRIADVLNAIQDAIAAQEDVIAEAREFKRSLMQRLFTYGPGREPAETRETEIGEIPAHWQMVALDSVTLSSAYGPRFSGKLYSAEGNVATLRTTDLDEYGTISYSTMPRAQLELDRFSQHILERNDFVVTRSGTCGIAAVFEEYSAPVLPGAFLIRFRLREAADPFFLRDYFNSPAGQRRVSTLAVGAVQKNISSTSLRAFLIPLPPRAEQAEMAAEVKAVDEKIVAEEDRKVALQDLFRSALHQLMTGQIRLLSDEGVRT